MGAGVRVGAGDGVVVGVGVGVGVAVGGSVAVGVTGPGGGGAVTDEGDITSTRESCMCGVIAERSICWSLASRLYPELNGVCVRSANEIFAIRAAMVPAARISRRFFLMSMTIV